MKKSLQVILPVAALMLTFSACKKDNNTTTTPTPTPTSNTPLTPSVGDVNGSMAAIKMTTTVSGFDLSSDIGVAVFFSAPGSTTYVDAGAVTINTNALDKAANNSYTKLATIGQTPATLGLDGGAVWTAAGGNGIPAINYTHAGSFPDYTGTVPATLTKANGLTFTFDASNTTNADSVYVLIAAGSTSILKHYGPTAGTVTISASDLSGLPTVSDNTGIIEVLPFNYTVQTIGGKSFAFIKERAVVKNININ